MEPQERIIVALDVDHASKALDYVHKLTPYVGGFKIGLEYSQGYTVRTGTYTEEEAFQEVREHRELLRLMGAKIFWDGKFMDIPNTVEGASRPVAAAGFNMFNVHCLGGPAMMRAAAKMAKDMQKVSPTGKRSLVLGVTLLTSLSYEDLVEVGLARPYEEVTLKEFWLTSHVPDFVLNPEKEAQPQYEEALMKLSVARLALLAKTSGLDGVVCSPQEINVVRSCWSDGMLVTPGIRAPDSPPDDQKRTMTPAEAIKAGADYLVIGRLITKQQDPVEATKRIIDEVAKAS